MDKLPVGQLPDISQSSLDDEIMIITEADTSQLRKEKISNILTDIISVQEDNALAKGSDDKLFVTNFGNASNITEGVLPTSVLPQTGVEAGEYSYPSSVTVNAQGQITAIEEGQTGANNANQDLSNLSPEGESVIDTRIDNKIESLSDIVNFNDITSLISFSSAVLTISSGLSVQIPNGLSAAGEDGTSESQYLSYTLANTVTKTYTTSSSSSILTIDNQGEVHEYLSYSEAATEPTGSAPLIYLNTTDNKMYKKLSAEDTFIQCFEAKIADGFTRGEDGTITAINSLISPIVVLSADTVHTAQIKVNALLNLPELENDNNFVNTMLEFTIESGITLTLPTNVSWQIGEVPEIVADGVTINRLIFDTTSGGDNWCGYHSYLNTVD